MIVWPVLTLALQGCGATLMPALVPLPRLPSPADRDSIMRVAVVVGEISPGLLDLHVPTAGEAAARGGGEAVSGWLDSFAGSGDPCAACVALACLPCVGAAGAVGGAARAQKPEDVRNFMDHVATARREMGTEVADLIRRGLVERAVVEEASIVPRSDPRGLSAERFDAVLEISAGLAVSGDREIDPLTSLQVSIEPRLRRLPGGELLRVGRFDCEPEARKFSEWSYGDLALLRSRMERFPSSLAEKVVDEVFLVQPVTLDVPEPAGWKPIMSHAGTMSWLASPGEHSLSPMHIGLRALYPPTSGAWFRGNKLVWNTTGSTRPTFRWETFPPVGDADSLEAMFGGRITDVSFEIVIAEARDGHPGGLVAHRTGLLANEYELESPLLPGRRYFWTVRARYSVDGRPRMTEWGCTHPLGRLTAEVPNLYSYRFQARRE